MFGERGDVHQVGGVGIEHPAARVNRALADGLGLIRADEVGIDGLFEPQPRTFGTRPPHRVEGEQTGLDLLDRNAAVGAGIAGGVQRFLPVAIDDDQPVRKAERRFQTLRKPFYNPLFYDEAVDDHGYVVLDILFESDLFLQVVHRAVDLHTGVPALAVALQFLYKLPLSAPHDGRFD